MSDTTSTTAPAAAEAAGDTTPNTTTPAEPPQATPATPDEPHPEAAEPDTAEATGEDEVNRWKRRARDWERRAKRNADLAERYPDLEERSRTLQEQYEEAIGTRARLEAELWRERAARAHAIPDDLLEFLTGSTEDEVLARAERLAQRTAAPAGPRRPAPNPAQGQSADSAADPADVLKQFLRDRLNRSP
ncbi:hypothetical protein ABGB09_29670 [Streptomyces sp. B8F3]|uniref:hypothetical protein n=1 Tax=Streptomyces sp. B8F3 TaxID=3153573 RepID=UPI00325E2A0D